MRIRSGVDIVEVSRLMKYAGDRENPFVKRCLTDAETEYCFGTPALREQKIAERFAARFAAKEAVAKALGTGIFSGGIGMTDIEIVKDELGAPAVVLHNEALDRARDIGVISISVSLSHEKEYAIANCNILTNEEN